MDTGGPNIRRLRILLRCISIALAAADVCVGRNAMITDGVSYLDMADAFFHHNWHMAINAYWSPLYPWIQGFFLWLLKPSARWEYPVVHLVNLFIYAAALASFEVFLRAFVHFHRRQWEGRPAGAGLPDWAWWVLGYSLFTWTSLIMIGAGREVRPDLCVAAFVYLASAFLLWMRTGATSWRTFALFGAVLGFGYLAKAVMFPLGFVFLAMALFSVASFRRAVPRVVIAAVVFGAIASPWAILLSRAKGRLTFGDTGRVNYEFFVDRDAAWFPTGRALKHPIQRISDFPPVYAFVSPVGGTYPLWYDTSYWHEGLAPRFNAKAEWKAVANALPKYLHLVFSPRLELYLVLGLVALLGISRERASYLRNVASNWPVIIPGLVAIGGYALIHTELRFVGAYVAILWMALFSGIGVPPSQKLRRWTRRIVIAMAIFSLYRPIVVDAHTRYPAYWKAAAALNADGVRPGDTIGVIGYETPAMGVARLARVRIVAQCREAGSSFGAQAPAVREQVIRPLERTGIRAIFTSEDPPQVQLGPGWQRLGDAADYVLMVARANSRVLAAKH